MEVRERVNELISGYLEQNGIELIEIIYRREQPGMVLRLLVNTPEGITLGQCETLNNYVGQLFDSENAIEGHYILEVSSPGLDRPITTCKDYERSMGKELDLTTYQAIDGRKTHEGKLVGMDEENIVLESSGVSTVISKRLVARARLKVEF